MKACTQCGRCCLHYADGGLVATAEEIAGWETFRPDIAAYVAGGEIWFDPGTGQRLTRCPFLAEDASAATVRYSCTIYADRPEDCRQYPAALEDMVRDDCEMLEVRDLGNPEQARRQLERLRTDH